MEAPTPTLENVNLEPLKSVLSGDIIVPEHGIHTSAYTLIKTLTSNAVEGCAGTTFNMAEPGRYATAMVSGRLVDFANMFAHLDLIHPAQPSKTHWEPTGFRIPSQFPLLTFELDFFPETDHLSITVQRVGIDINIQGVEYANRQVADALSSYIKLVKARSNA